MKKNIKRLVIGWFGFVISMILLCCYVSNSWQYVYWGSEAKVLFTVGLALSSVFVGLFTMFEVVDG